jgi:hypothetical protein
LTVKLGGLKPAEQYRLENADTEVVETCSGEDLIAGLNLTATEAPQSFLIFYSAED